MINLYPETVSDGFGLRYAIYFAGCENRCEGCHNPQSWNPKAGQKLDEVLFEKIVKAINANSLLDGITLSGGDPFYNPEGLLKFLIEIKKRCKINVWCYTGYTYEKLAENMISFEALKLIDVLVDGKFLKDLFDPRLYFRGSSNQRILYLKSGLISHVAKPEEA